MFPSKSRTLWQKSPFTSSTRPPTRWLASWARYAKICSANGYMQPVVLPLPIAPKMAMPVYSPRSGMMSQRGFGGFWTLGMMELTHHQIQFVSVAKVRILGQRLLFLFPFRDSLRKCRRAKR